MDRARVLRGRLIDAEQRLWRHLRSRHLQGFKFRPQHEIDKYIVDFVCTEAMLIMELDGGHHLDQVAYDESRTQQLQTMGYRILRFWNNDVPMKTEIALEAILKTLASQAPHPNPLPGGDRGLAAARIDE